MTCLLLFLHNAVKLFNCYVTYGISGCFRLIHFSFLAFLWRLYCQWILWNTTAGQAPSRFFLLHILHFYFLPVFYYLRKCVKKMTITGSRFIHPFNYPWEDYAWAVNSFTKMTVVATVAVSWAYRSFWGAHSPFQFCCLHFHALEICVINLTSCCSGLPRLVGARRFLQLCRIGTTYIGIPSRAAIVLQQKNCYVSIKWRFKACKMIPEGAVKGKMRQSR